jgi:hypothetical protein
MKKQKRVAIYIVLAGIMLFGTWLLKKGFYDTGYANEEEERLFLIDAVLNVRGIPVTIESRQLLQNVSTEDLLKELGLRKDKDGNYFYGDEGQ